MRCCICLQELLNPIKLLCCSNEFCSKCLDEWKQIRNVCPYCRTQLDTHEVNKLKQPENQQFDNGSMLLETEMNELNLRINHLQHKLAMKREEAHCLKSNMNPHHLTFLEDQMFLVEEYRSFVAECVSKDDRINCMNYLQLAAELILKMESVLDGQMIEELEYGYEDDWNEDWDDEWDDYEYEQYEKKSNKTQKNRESKTSFSQKNKSKKSIL